MTEQCPVTWDLTPPSTLCTLHACSYYWIGLQLLLDRPAALPRLLHLGISIYLDLAKADLGQNTHLALRTAGLSLTLPDMGGS